MNLTKHRHIANVIGSLVLGAASVPVLAATLSVGPGKTYATPCRAFAAAAHGDIIQIDAMGVYNGDVCGIYRDNLTIRGINGRPKINANGVNAMGKGIWIVAGSNTTIENVEIYGAKVPDRNGAAIRLEGKHLTLRNVYLHDNEMGVLTGNDGVSNVLIENSEFRGLKAAYSNLYHNVYIGHVNSLIFRGNYSHDADVGHNLKSRAETNLILSNRFSSTDGGQPSYEIDLPNAGVAHLIGNIIHQPAANKNSTLVSFGSEGATNAKAELYVVNNTFINDNSSYGYFIVVGNSVSTPVLMQNNIFAGTGIVINQGTAIEKTNYRSLTPAFVDRSKFDLRPAVGAPMINAGTAPEVSVDRVSLVPTSQYKHIGGSEARPVDGKIDIGAYEAASATIPTPTPITTTPTSPPETAPPATPTPTTTIPDLQAPTVAFGSPSNTATLAGNVRLAIVANDNKTVAKIVLQVDGREVASVTGNQLNGTWYTGAETVGPHTLTAVAIDTSNNRASRSITVTVKR